MTEEVDNARKTWMQADDVYLGPAFTDESWARWGSDPGPVGIALRRLVRLDPALVQEVPHATNRAGHPARWLVTCLGAVMRDDAPSYRREELEEMLSHMEENARRTGRTLF